MSRTALATLGTAAAAAAAITFLWRRSCSSSYPPRGANTPGHSVASNAAIKAGNTAVITGGGSGIGRAVALELAAKDMNIVLADMNEAAMESVRGELVKAGAWPSHILCVKTDVSDYNDVLKLKEKVWHQFGGCHFLMNNAAIQNNGKCSAFEHLDRWMDTLKVNLHGVLHGCQAFTQAMVQQDVPCVIVNTGSKQGLTAPPGDTAYNVSKTGVNFLTAGLQHSLRNIPSCKVNAFLLVPGWTISMIATNADRRLQGAEWNEAKAEDETTYRGVKDAEVARAALQARGAWTSKQVAETLLTAVKKGAPFFIICEDNETTTAMDNGRMQWTIDDVIFKRVPLSRWSSQYSAEYKAVSATF